MGRGREGLMKVGEREEREVGGRGWLEGDAGGAD